MIPGSFQYHSPSTIDDAIKFLSENDEAKILAGGHSLLPMMKLRFAEPQHLVDINGIDELKGIRKEGKEIVIGSMTTEKELIASDLLWKKCPLVPEAAKLIGDPQVRNRGTIGGDISHGDPANDHPAIMIAVDASFVLAGPNGSRTVAADGFFKGTFWTELEENEILKDIHIPAFSAGTGYGFNKLKRKTGDFATAAAAVVLTVKGGVCSDVRIALTNVGPMALRAEGAEGILRGQAVTEALIEQAAQKAMEICEPAEDLRGDVEYKTQMAGEMTRRSIRDALARAGG